MKKIAKIMPLLAIALFVYGFVQSQVVVNAKTEDNYISDGIYIEGLHVGGMTAEEAELALEEYLVELGETPFTLEAGDKQIVFTAAQMGTFALSTFCLSILRNILQHSL